jgi:hypothetical protein
MSNLEGLGLESLGIVSTESLADKLRNECIEVFESPSYIFDPKTLEDAEPQIIEDGFYTVSNANGNIHGKVSNKGSVLQMKDLVNIAYDVNIENGLNLDFKNAELDYFKDESICTLKIPLGISRFETANGFKDETEAFLFIKNGFGGNACNEVGIFTHRFVCDNGMEVRHGLNYFKSKHTEKMNELTKVFLSQTLPKMMDSVHDLKATSQKLDKATISKEDIEAFKQSMFGYKKGDELSTKKKNMVDAYNLSLKEETERTGLTAWSLLQSATNYTNHKHFNASKEFIVTGSGATFNAKAEKMCLEMAN